jgi:hypothetical protein
VGAPAYEANGPAVTAALQEVMDMAALRADRLSEILTQVVVPYSYFAALLNLQPGRHRRTYELMSTALILSGIAVMQFKHYFATRRPADRSPLIQPVLLTPNHGSYPAGHSCQSYILSTVLQSLVGNNLGLELANQLNLLAYRIGENRVVAGLHYMADITVGEQLGKDLAAHFITLATPIGNSPPSTALEWLWTNAKAEWP